VANGELYYYEQYTRQTGKIYRVDIEKQEMELIDIELPWWNGPIQISDGVMYCGDYTKGTFKVYEVSGMHSH
jgi:hypothetical protein